MLDIEGLVSSPEGEGFAGRGFGNVDNLDVSQKYYPGK